MAKNPGCWANVLDDCDGPLTGEHLVSVAIFAAATGMSNNRSGRVGRDVYLKGSHHLADGKYKLEDVKANILCRYHNGATNELDTEGGKFARAVERWQLTQVERQRYPTFKRTQRTFVVGGRRFERLLLKLAINNSFKGELPIGGDNAPAGWPTRELVEMVYGRREIVRPAGLFQLSAVGNEHTFVEDFSPLFFDNGGYTAGCVWTFLTLFVGVQFTQQALPADLFHRHPSMQGFIRLPFNAIDSGPLNTEVRLSWR